MEGPQKDRCPLRDRKRLFSAEKSRLGTGPAAKCCWLFLAGEGSGKRLLSSQMQVYRLGAPSVQVQARTGS